MFRSFKELNILGAAVYVIKIVVPINTVLLGLELGIESGHVKVETVVAGTEGGLFDEVLPVRPVNNMTTRPIPFYTPAVVFSAGGTLVGGTLIDVVTLKADTNSVRATSVGSMTADERGVSPGTYYFRVTNLGASDPVTGTLKARWEERP